MKKVAKALFSFAGYALAIYVAIFVLWLFFGFGCLQYASQQGEPDSACGNDVMSQVIRTTHRPLIKFMEWDLNLRNKQVEFAN